MPNSISTVGFGSPYASEQADIQRRQKMAELIQKQSMDMRKSMREVAEAIILAKDIRGKSK